MSFDARPPADGDAEEVAELTYAYHEAHLPGFAVRETEQELHRWWARFDLERDCRVLREASTGRLAAIGTLENAGDVLDLTVRIDPALAGRGLGSALVGWAEREAEARGLSAVRAGRLAVDAAAGRLLAARGYSDAGSVLVMEIDVHRPQPAPAWPEGCAVSALEPGGESPYHDIVEEAFAGSWTHVRRPPDEWLVEARAQAPDPKLWFLVRDRGEPVASAVCGVVGTRGWVWHLAVRPAWRRRGLARALLLHSFAELHARGRNPVRLQVDAANETGAVRLYESVGMRVVAQRDFCERAVAR